MAVWQVGDQVSVSTTGLDLAQIGSPVGSGERRRVPGVIVSMRFDKGGIPFYTVDIGTPSNRSAVTVRGWRLHASLDAPASLIVRPRKSDLPVQKGDKAMNELVRKAAMRHFLATVKPVAEATRVLEGQGIATDEAIDEAIATLPLDRVSTLIAILRQSAGDLDSTARGIEAYQSVGIPYGDTYGDLLKWMAEQPGEGHEAEHAAEKVAERKEDKATEEDEDRAADEGMFDREEEQLLRAEDERMNADPDDSVDK
jgi:hypothetical protein